MFDLTKINVEVKKKTVFILFKQEKTLKLPAATSRDRQISLQNYKSIKIN